MKEILDLIDDIIGMEEARDKKFQEWGIQNHKASLTVGESKILFFLKNLKELVEREGKKGTFAQVKEHLKTSRIGCIGQAWCESCKQVKSGTCLCMLICPDCRGKMTDDISKDELEKYYEQFK